MLVYSCAGKQPPPPRQQPTYPKPYKVGRQWYQPLSHARGFRQKGLASWYGKKFHGRRTSNGEIYDMHGVSAAHKTLPFGTYVRVRNLNNRKTVEVRINDRGPFVRDRIIDLSYGAAKAIGLVGPGTAPVELVALGTRSPQTPAGSPGVVYRPADYYHGNFTFQVGAFANRENALRLKQKLQRIYKNTHIVTYDDGERLFYRVRVGKCSSLQDAIEYEALLTEHGFTDVFTVAE